MARNSIDFTYDDALELKDAGLIAADDIAQVGGSDKILDLGEARYDGRVIIDATAVEVADDDERFDVGLQFSDSATFASGVVQGPMQPIGAAGGLVSADTDNGAGRYELAFCNQINGVTYRYMRMVIDVSGTVATGVNFTAFVAKSA